MSSAQYPVSDLLSVPGRRANMSDFSRIVKTDSFIIGRPSLLVTIGPISPSEGRLKCTFTGGTMYAQVTVSGVLS